MGITAGAAARSARVGSDPTVRLTLGTAQLAAGYGATRRRTDPPDVGVVRELLTTARALGLTRLDTAPDYGDAERLLGACALAGWEVDTKLPGLPGELEGAPDALVVRWVHDRVEGSLRRLGLERVATLILHRPGVLLGAAGPAVRAALAELRSVGRIGAVGVSVYEPDELDALRGIGAAAEIDVVQAPASPVDRRMLRLAVDWPGQDASWSLHARSAFLQGLLLVAPEDRPTWARPLAASLAPWDGWIAAQGVLGEVATAACLGFLLSRPEVERVLVGAEDSEQLSRVVRTTITLGDSLGAAVPDEVAIDDPEVVDPRRWRVGA